MSTPEVLSSWKEIARHLGKGVRTVQRWERCAGLPVHRPHPGSGIVIADPREIDAWIHRQSGSGCSEDEELLKQLDDLRQENQSLSRQLEAAKLEIAALRSERAIFSQTINLSRRSPRSKAIKTRERATAVRKQAEELCRAARLQVASTRERLNGAVLLSSYRAAAAVATEGFKPDETLPPKLS